MTERQKSLFYKLIKCYCGSNFRYTKQRSKKCYVCSAYNNYQTHERNLIEQEMITDFIQRYCHNEDLEYQETNEFITSIIDKINISEEGDITITYQNGYQQIYSNNLIKY